MVTDCPRLSEAQGLPECPEQVLWDLGPGDHSNPIRLEIIQTGQNGGTLWDEGTGDKEGFGWTF